MSRFLFIFCMIFIGCSPKSEVNDISSYAEDVNSNNYLQSEEKEVKENENDTKLDVSLAVEDEIIIFVQKYQGEVDLESHYVLAHRGSDMIHHISELSTGAKEWIKEFGFTPKENGDLKVLRSLSLLEALFLSGRSLNSIDDIEGLLLKELKVSCPITNIDVIKSMNTLVKLDVTRSRITYLPDMSELTLLNEFHLKSSKIRSLDNIETIPSNFFLYLRNCDDLEDIDSLRFSNVSGILIDNKDVAPQWVSEGEEGTYNRFEDWFDKYLPEIQERNPGFKIYFDVDDLYGNPM